MFPRDVGHARLYPSGARPRAATPQCVADVVVRRGRRRRRRRWLQLRWLQLVVRRAFLLTEGEGRPRAAQRALLCARLARRHGGEQLQHLHGLGLGLGLGLELGLGLGLGIGIGLGFGFGFGFGLGLELGSRSGSGLGEQLPHLAHAAARGVRLAHKVGDGAPG